MSQAYATAIKDYSEQMHTIGACYMPFSLWLEKQKQSGRYWELANNIFLH